MTILHYVNEDQSEIGRSSLGGMGWRATVKSHPGCFQTRRNAAPKSLSRGAIIENRPGGTRPTILKLSPTMRATKRPWTTWLTRKLLWTLGTRRKPVGHTLLTADSPPSPPQEVPVDVPLYVPGVGPGLSPNVE